MPPISEVSNRIARIAFAPFDSASSTMRAITCSRLSPTPWSCLELTAEHRLEAGADSGRPMRCADERERTVRPNTSPYTSRTRVPGRRSSWRSAWRQPIPGEAHLWYILASVGADASRAFAAPIASSRSSCDSSSRRARYRSCTGAISSTTASPTACLSRRNRPRQARLDRLGRLAGRHRHDVDEVGHAGLVAGAAYLAARVGEADLNLRRMRSGSSSSAPFPARSRRSSTSSSSAPGGHDPRPDLRVDACRNDERTSPVPCVEPLGDVPGELEVLALVVADRTMSVW